MSLKVLFPLGVLGIAVIYLGIYLYTKDKKAIGKEILSGLGKFFMAIGAVTFIGVFVVLAFQLCTIIFPDKFVW